MIEELTKALHRPEAMRFIAGFMRLQALLLAVGYPIAAAWALTTGWHTTAALATAGGLWWQAGRLRELARNTEETG